MTTFGHPSRWRFIAAVACLVAIALPGATSARGDGLQHVTVIGDSVSAALNWGPAEAILGQGIDLDLEATACRRTEEDSCPGPDGVRPPTLIELVQSIGPSVGPTVVAMTGYNDYEDQYQKDIGDALTVLAGLGVKRVVWVDLHEARVPYVSMNAAIGYWATLHPELTVLDWNTYSRSHLDWFQDDGIHLTEDGTIALATFVHSGLVDLGVVSAPAAAPVTTASPALRIVTAALPAATTGDPYSSLLAAAGGRQPYRWKALSRLPRGFGLAHDGLITGIPRSGPGAFPVLLRVTDAAGRRVVRRIVLHVDG